ncbi:hypothetical protein [Granulosicoccus antarcticus]|uniref:Cadherin domain-containing protein n=1 Tax=Granulosicoccus antarcticus IMCC3135 TaxID=1192854 RepID=A0A2Z2NKN0_9GAMM|nr:hypothetical protein [Granulosicoccus antarcticus]ASJ71075.1 hypothetical protein IMCC3135_04810 [Granulosicoccus antarcticus IMCC3135]
MKSRIPAVLRQCNLSTAAICVSTLFLASCGGGSGDNASGGNSPLVVEGGSGTPADDIETSQLLRKAATGTSVSLGKNVTGMQRVGDSSSSVGLLLDTSPLESLVSLMSSKPDEESISTDEVLNTNVEDDIASFIESLLGLDKPLAEVDRTGNHITIDPDDASFCEEELLDESSTANDLADCQSLVSNLLVEVDAATEDSGLITVNFAQQELLLIGYSPVSTNYEIKLPAVETLLNHVEQLDGGSGSMPSMQGALRFSATVNNDAVNAESGTFSISVTEALSIIGNDGTNISLQPSTLLSVSSDTATTSASIEFDIGALNAAFSSDDDADGLSTSVLAFAGLTARMDVSNDGDSLLVSNVGIGNGPLTLTVDSEELIKLVMGTFGFSIEGNTGTITLNDNLDFLLSAGSVNSLSAEAPTGTALTVQDNGISQVLLGGPLLMSVVDDNDGAPITDSISIGVGDCFMADDSIDSVLPFVAADCGL